MSRYAHGKTIPQPRRCRAHASVVCSLPQQQREDAAAATRENSVDADGCACCFARRQRGHFAAIYSPLKAQRRRHARSAKGMLMRAVDLRHAAPRRRALRIQRRRRLITLFARSPITARGAMPPAYAAAPSRRVDLRV